MTSTPTDNISTGGRMADNRLADLEQKTVANSSKLPRAFLRRDFIKKKAPRDYVLPSFPLGKVGILMGAGGTGKSFFALQAAFQVAAGRCCDFALGGLSKCENGIARVLYISLEDEADDIERRYGDVADYWETDEDRKLWMSEIAESDFVRVIPLAGQNITLINSDHSATMHYQAVLEEAKAMPGLRLIIIDTLKRSHRGEENSNDSMGFVLQHFEFLAKETGAAVLLLHHENKNSTVSDESGQGASRGASAIIDNARYAIRMQIMPRKEATSRHIDDDERRQWVKVSLEKSNFGPYHPPCWLQRQETGVLIAKEPPMACESNSNGNNTRTNGGFNGRNHD